MTKCPNCGENVSCHDEVCSCCGSHNPEYRPPDRETSIFLGQGMEAFKEASYEAAIHYFNQAIDLDADVFDAYFYIAASYSTLKRPEEAIQVMRKACLLRPGSAPISYNLGMLYKQIGHKAEAQKHFEKALALAETDSAVTDRKQFKQNIENALKEYKRWKLF